MNRDSVVWLSLLWIEIVWYDYLWACSGHLRLSKCLSPKFSGHTESHSGPPFLLLTRALSLSLSLSSFALSFSLFQVIRNHTEAPLLRDLHFLAGIEISFLLVHECRKVQKYWNYTEPPLSSSSPSPLLAGWYSAVYMYTRYIYIWSHLSIYLCVYISICTYIVLYVCIYICPYM